MADTLAPTLDDLQRIALAAFQAIPETFRRKAEGLVIRVEDFPDDETVDEMELESDFDLLGLYRGVSLSLKSQDATPQDVDMVFLYRRAILDEWCESGEALEAIVRNVLVHEIGHHFGFSDADMESIEREA